MNHKGIDPPSCKKIPHRHETHGDVRVDDYYWLNDRENKDVIAYLEAENAYTDEVMKDTEELQSKLYDEIVGRIKQQDESVPYFKNGYWYYTRYEEGKEYPVYCRKKDSMDSEELILLNVNEMAEGHDFYQVGALSVSEDNRWLAFSVDTVSRRIYTIYFKDLESGEISDLNIPNTTGLAVWPSDDRYLFFTTKDEQTLRSDKVHRFDRQTNSSELVFREPDETFYAHIHKTKSRKYLVIGSTSTLTSEYRILKANDPTGSFRVFQPRVRGMEYSISHFEDRFYILTNWEATNFRLMKSGLENTEREHWQEVVAHRDETLLEGVELFNDFMVLEERTMGLTHLKVHRFSTNESYYIPFEEETYTVGSSVNPEFDSHVLRFGYTSLVTPSSTFSFDMLTKERTLLKQQEVVGGYDATKYHSERIYVEARDGARIPVSLVYRKDFKPAPDRPLLQYGYGSYGHSMDPYFSSARLSLLDRGVSFAIAHIRGGEELGRNWYDTGKLLQKKNTFYDFIDVALWLIDNGYSSPEHLHAMGGSAGGLLMGAVVNMRPDLWKSINAAVPFVDVVTTMLDESIPLTTGEFDEWGNPKDEEYYHYIKSYSPYDNVEPKDYPNMLVTTGLHDSQVQYWEPAKWVALLREKKTDDNILLMKTEMNFGHSGASGRFQRIKEIALDYAFLLDLEGITS